MCELAKINIESHPPRRLLRLRRRLIWRNLKPIVARAREQRSSATNCSPRNHQRQKVSKMSSSKQRHNYDLNDDGGGGGSPDNDDADDPYNQPSSGAGRYSLLEQQYLSDTARAEQQQQYAYDSMSTILEVDSEGSEVSADRLRDRDSASGSAFLAAPTASNKRRTTPATGKPSSSASKQEEIARSMSPIAVPEGKNFSGTLSALAQQFERLSQERTGSRNLDQQTERSSSTTTTTTTKESDSDTKSSSKSRKMDDKEAEEEISMESNNDTETDINSMPASSSDSPNTTNTIGLEEDEEESAGEERARSRPNSAAESLMMIAVSPMSSPRTRQFPIGQLHARPKQETGDRRSVEVSNKSTITSIDLGLMNRMVEKYFVDKLDKGIQSIAFDCEESGETVEVGAGYQLSARNRAAQNRRDRASGGASASSGGKVMMKSVAVGTEKFSRERFSLLPPTKTRSTQTKSNIDNDIGASETRRFKLSHLDFGSLRSSKRQAVADEETNEAKINRNRLEDQTENNVMEVPANQTRKQQAEGSHRPAYAAGAAGDGDASQSRVVAPTKQTTTTTTVREDKVMNGGHNEVSDDIMDAGRAEDRKQATRSGQQAAVPAAGTQQDSLADSSRGTRLDEKEFKSSSSPTSESPTKQIAEVCGTDHQSKKNITGDRQGGLSNVNESLSIVNRGVSPSSSPIEIVNHSGEGKSRIDIEQIGASLIPNLKTELRVIIEFNDSRQKQISELTSNSQFVNGKLSKQSQITTSKHVRQQPTNHQPAEHPQQFNSTSASSSPREVYRRLESAGREHSLMFNDEDKQQGHLSRHLGGLTPLRAASSMSSLAKANSEPSNGWRQVSKSSVCNEIETDTHRSWRKQLKETAADSSKEQATTVADDADDIRQSQRHRQLLMSTDARIRHLPDSKSALELKSRAARRYERLERDPISKKLVSSGRMVERTLIQSEAGFDENDLDDGGKMKSIDAKTIPVQRAENRPSSGTTPTDTDSGASRQTQRTIPMLRVSDVEPKPPTPTKPKPTLVEPTTQNSNKQPKVEVDAEAPTTTRTTKLEIQEESEDRRQVTRNGRLVFDDRLNERRYETHRAGSADDNGGSPMAFRRQEKRFVASPSPKACSPAPLLSPGGILRNAHVHSPIQRQLLKPISLRASPIQQQQLADQTSNLSSDPETMDSGIAPSGAGSSNALNQRPASTNTNPTSSQSRTSQSHGSQWNRQLNQQSARPQEEPTSLTFVDDDDDDDEMDRFVEQLGTEKGKHIYVQMKREEGSETLD